MEEKVIEVKNIRKTFKGFGDRAHSLKEILINLRRLNFQKIEVIKGISFEVNRGEVVGLIGRNGCGKSTTLKMLSKLLKPTSGEIIIHGRVSSLIELGAGFHPDMTGRENIYINASIFGFTREEINRKIDDIIQFSELEEFIDSPVRVYSSGMYLRLAFSVAISVEPEILLVDEILGVGDAAFQRKCASRIKEMTESGMTIVIVSHSTGQIEQLCDRAIWLEDGIIKEEGFPRVVCKHYLEASELYRVERAKKEFQEFVERVGSVEEAKKQNRSYTCQDICEQYDIDAYRSGIGEIEITKVELLDQKGRMQQEFKKGDTFKIALKYRSIRNSIPFSITVALARDDGVPIYEVSTESDMHKKILSNYDDTICFEFLENHILPGRYYLNIYIVGENGVEYDILRGIILIKIVSNECSESGVISMKHRWIISENSFSF